MNKKEIILLIVGLVIISIFMPFHLSTPSPTIPIINSSTCLGCYEHPESVPMFILAVFLPIMVCLVITFSYTSKKIK